jgi:hypothetical protein
MLGPFIPDGPPTTPWQRNDNCRVAHGVVHARDIAERETKQQGST